jgi:hypothetical protein
LKKKKNHNSRKTEQLGVSYSTACNRLRKKVMFKLAQELKKDICFQCNEKIETIEQFSIDHKKPWLDNSPDLFWDLDNIAFSHLSCNCRVSTRLKGEKHPNCKLSDKDIKNIRKDITNKKGINQIAKKYGVHRKTIQDIRDNNYRAETP